MSRLFRLSWALCTALLLGVAFSPTPSHSQDAPFITVWDTDNSGESNDNQVIIPGEGTNYTVEWEELGDESNNGSETVAQGDTTLTFPNPGVYRVKISGDFTRIHFGGDSGGDAEKIKLVTQWGDIVWSTMAGAFSTASNLDLDTNDSPDLSNVNSMARMFKATPITSNNSTMSSWDVSSVTNMKDLFWGANNFNGNIREWDVSNVTNMLRMFNNATKFNQYIGEWDVSSVTNMGGMFDDSHSFNKDIGSWDVSSVTNMNSMFMDANSFNQNIGEWNVSGVTTMQSMFSGAEEFDQDIGDWNVSNVTDMLSMFSGASSFDQDIGRWNVSSVTRMSRMFVGAVKFNQDISDWDVSNVERIDNMFNTASSFNQSLEEWDVTGVNISDLNGFFDNTALSPKNYDRTLIGWAGQNLGNNFTFGASGVKYCESGPFRTLLVEALGWAVNDGGQKVGCPNLLTVSQARQISSDGKTNFGHVGISTRFSDVLGSGRVTIARYGDAPRGIQGVDKANVSQYRIVIAEGGITAFQSADLGFAVSEFGGISQSEDITIYRRETPGVGSFDSLATTVDNNGTPNDVSDDTLSATVSSTSDKKDFGEFVFASDTNKLPVELASFEGVTTEDGVRLTWQTATETNNSGFDVQRRAEGSSWTTVGFVEGAGTPSDSQSYEFTDADLPYDADRLSYRLRQVDNDGTATLSDPVTIERNASKVELLGTFPNPASQQTTVRFALPERQEVDIRLYDALGRQVRTVVNAQKEGRHEETVDVSGLSSGTYFIHLWAGGQTKSQQITVVR